MTKKLKILYASSEVEPFAKTGGLADVAGSLPREIKKLGADIRIILPHYGFIDEQTHKITEVPGSEFEVTLGEQIVKGNLKQASLDLNGKQVPVYFIHNDNFYNRGGIYVNPITNLDYPDNGERFIFFSRAILQVLKKLGWKPDIIHCNDWQTGLIPLYLKHTYKDDEFYKDIKTIFTIHNLAYQGLFDKDLMSIAGISWDVFTIDGIEFYDRINFMKAGIVYSDYVTTVSPRYAKEICSSVEYGYGLEGVLAYRKAKLIGILNGADYSTWSPLKDNLIPQKYSAKNIAKKVINKKALVEKFNLPFNENIPVIGMISRLADQKGFDLIEAAADELMKFDMQMIFLGAGDYKYQNLLERMRKNYPPKIGVHIGFSNELAHLIEAGSDIFLMPSKYEPCGLNQIYSLKYGTVPIVRAIGGLEDSVEHYNTETKSATGFKFFDYDHSSLTDAVRFALEVYRDKPAWIQLMKNGMKQDFSWKASAKKYIALYRKVLRVN